MSNPLKNRLLAGEKGTNTWLTLPGAVAAEFVARAGFDAVTVDMQHGLMGMESAIAMVQTINLCGSTAMVRLSGNQGSEIAKFLDAGAQGLICPMVNTEDDCRRFVRSALYAPKGERSFGPNRVRLAQGAPGYFAGANGAAMLFAMIETAEALENFEAIADVPDLFGIYIGPADLSLSLGHNPATEQGIPEMLEVYRTITEGAHKRGLKVGFQCSTIDQIRQIRETDVDFLTLLNDNRMLSLASEQALAAARD